MMDLATFPHFIDTSGRYVYGADTKKAPPLSGALSFERG